MSFGTRWTKEDIAMLKKQAGGTFPKVETVGTIQSMKIIPPKKKPLLNKTETLFRAELERRGHKIILCQALTLRLGDRMTYRPDFVTVESVNFSLTERSWSVRITCYETKAPHRFKTAGVTKLKAAAAIYPWIKFVLVERNKSQWSERTIGL